MNAKLGKIRKDLIAVILLAGIFVTLAIFPVDALVIQGDKDSTALKVNSNESVSLSFIHSVELSRWIEIYKIDDDRLVLTESLTKSCGWGLPSTEENFSFKEIDGETWMSFEMQRPVDSLVISTNPINDYILTVNNDVIELENFGKFVEIKVERISLLKYLLRR